MFRKLVITFLLLLCLFNTISGGDEHACVSDGNPSSLQNIVDERLSQEQASNSSGHQESSSKSHQCHFAHCAFVLSEAAHLLLPQTFKASFHSALAFPLTAFRHQLLEPPTV